MRIIKENLPDEIANSLNIASQQTTKEHERWEKKATSVPVGTKIKGYTLTDIGGDLFWLNSDKPAKIGNLTPWQFIENIGEAKFDSEIKKLGL